MRILVAARGLFPEMLGGSARHTTKLVRTLAGSDVDVDVIHPGGTPVFQHTDGVQETMVDYGKNILSFAQNVAGRLQETGWVNRNYTMAYSDGMTLRAALAILRCPVIANLHGLHMFQRRYNLGWDQSGRDEAVEYVGDYVRRHAAKRFLREVDFAVSLGSGLTEILTGQIGISSDRVLVLPNAVDAPSERPGSDSRQWNRLLFVGSVDRRKGFKILKEAVQSVPEARLDVVGKSPGGYLDDPENEIRYLGVVSDPQLTELYQNNGCLVLPSLREGLPTVILEAMAEGMPVIASDVGAVRDAVDHQTGFLVDPGSSASLKAAIGAFLGLPIEDRKRMGQAARDRIQVGRFTWDEVGRRFLDFAAASRVTRHTHAG